MQIIEHFLGKNATENASDRFSRTKMNRYTTMKNTPKPPRHYDKHPLDMTFNERLQHALNENEMVSYITMGKTPDEEVTVVHPARECVQLMRKSVKRHAEFTDIQLLGDYIADNFAIMEPYDQKPPTVLTFDQKVQRAIDLNLMVSYIEPSDVKGEVNTIRRTAAECIEWMRVIQKAEPQMADASELELLIDYITVFWADIEG